MAQTTKEKPKAAAADGSALFELPHTPLGRAARKFAGHVSEIAEAKRKRDDVKKIVIDEMKKEGRESLTVTVGNDNWEFTVKKGKEDLRCVKKTRQPKPKTTQIDED